MYIIGFNGPPRSGKDSIAKHLDYLIPSYSEIHPLSLPMRRATFAMGSMVYDEATYEAIKDKPLQIFHGRSIREVMIDLSEKHVKLIYGHDFWGRSLLVGAEMLRHEESNVLIVPDIGFPSECVVFDTVAGDTFLTVQVSREGFDWKNDSRRYCSGANLLQINNVSIEDSAELVLKHCRERLGWAI